jgi:phosphohistidine phosphatase
MKTLYIVRHAKSSWDDPDLDDFDRPLNERGEKDAPHMGKRLRDKSVNPDVIYSSPAVRAITTATFIAKALDYPVKEIKTDRRLYHADLDVLMEIVHRSDDNHDSIMIAGHNPGLTEFVNNLMEDKISNLPTASVMAIEFDVDTWRGVAWSKGHRLFFEIPKKK